MLKERYPDKCFILAANNEKITVLENARKAEEAIGATLFIPHFKPRESGSDWNDYVRLNGKEDLKRSLNFAITIAEAKRDQERTTKHLKENTHEQTSVKSLSMKR